MHFAVALSCVEKIVAHEVVDSFLALLYFLLHANSGGADHVWCSVHSAGGAVTVGAAGKGTSDVVAAGGAVVVGVGCTVYAVDDVGCADAEDIGDFAAATVYVN